MKSTQLKKSRTWNSLMSNQRRVEGDEIYQPKDFARAYTLSTVKENLLQGYKKVIENLSNKLNRKD
jgi:hypothetical protein